MQRDDFGDDLIYRPSLALILIAIALWSAIGFLGAIIFAGLQ